MRGTMLRRLLQVGIVVAISTIMLGATAGLSAAAPGGHGHSGEGRQNASDQAGDPGGTRPGWGCGDTNHVHTGPLGLGLGAVSPCSSRESAAGAATHFAVSAPSSATAGTAFSFTVTAQDQSNNTATSYGGTIHFTSSDVSASLLADSALTNGTGTFSATLDTAGNQTITATDTSNSSVTGTSGVIAVS